MQHPLIGVAVGLGMAALAQADTVPPWPAARADDGVQLSLKQSVSLTPTTRAPRRMRDMPLVPLRLRLSAMARAVAPGPTPPSPPLLPAQLSAMADFPRRAVPVRTPALAALLEQARFWSSQGRDDLAEEALAKLFRISPDDLQGLEVLARIHVRRRQPEAVRLILERLRRLDPGAGEIARIEALERVDGSDRDALRVVRQLARDRRYEDAATAMRKLYPDGLPTEEMTLEYWNLVASAPNGNARARTGLQQLLRQEPDNPRYRLALNELLTARAPVDRSALAQIIAMTEVPAYAKQARNAWRRAMLNLEDSAASVTLLRAYLGQEEGDTAVRNRLEMMVASLEARRRLLADPAYQARRSGLALLAAGKLDAAQAALERAHATRADDIEVLNGLGLLRMRQGRHAHSETLFRRAAQLDASQRSRWNRMAGVARYWGLLAQAESASEAQQFAIAEDRLRQALAQDRNEPAALLALASLYLAQARPLDAERSYLDVLALQPANTRALEGLVRLYLDTAQDERMQQMLSRLDATQRTALTPAMNSARAGRLRMQADAAVTAGDPGRAISLLEEAVRLAPADPWLRFDLGRLYVRRNDAGDAARADRLFAALLAPATPDPSALHAAALLDDSRARELNALANLERMPAEAREPRIGVLQRRLWVAARLKRATALRARGQDSQATQELIDTGAAIGIDIDLAPQVAEALADVGSAASTQAARSLLDGITTDRSAQNPASRADWRLRRAEIIARFNDDAELGSELGELDRMTGDSGLSPSQATRLTALRSRLQRLRADTALSLERYAEAAAGYRQLLLRAPTDRDAGIGLVDALIGLGEIEESRNLIDQQITARRSSAQGMSADESATLASRLIDLKEDAAAVSLIEASLASAVGNARLLDQAAQLAERGNRPDQAIDYLQRSLATSLQERTSDERAAAPDAATGRSYRRLADLLDARSNWIAGAVDYRTRSGSTGKSEYAYSEVPIQWQQPWREGSRIILQAAAVHSSAGTLDLGATDDAARFGSVLLCQPVCGAGSVAQDVRGLGLSAAIERGNLRADLGVTPLGFPIVNLVGGIVRKGDLGDFSYSVDASRRAATGSVLSYAGTRDPRTGETWGGVVANGLRFGLSRDAGGAFGAWSSLGLHRLTGTNVQANNRMQLMGGGYWRLINEDDRLLTVGMNAMLWRFSDNAGEYTLGHGGYYSPGRFASVSLPVSFGQRTARLSYTVRAALSSSRSSTAGAAYFPTRGDLQTQAEALQDINGIEPRYAASTGRGLGRSLAATFEYQMHPKLFFGGRFEIDRSTDYAPNRLQFYFRYNVDRTAARPVTFPPEPLIPASQF